MHSGQILNDLKKNITTVIIFWKQCRKYSSTSLPRRSYFATCVFIIQGYWNSGNKYKRNRDTFLHVSGGYTRDTVWPKGNSSITNEDDGTDQFYKKNKIKWNECFIVVARLTPLSSLRKTKENRREIQV